MMSMREVMNLERALVNVLEREAVLKRKIAELEAKINQMNEENKQTPLNTIDGDF